MLNITCCVQKVVLQTKSCDEYKKLIFGGVGHHSNCLLKLYALSSVHIYSFLRAKSFQQLYNGRKIVESWEKSVFCYRFFSRFCESQGADASTHDRLFTYSEQNRPDKSQRVNMGKIRKHWGCVQPFMNRLCMWLAHCDSSVWSTMNYCMKSVFHTAYISVTLVYIHELVVRARQLSLCSSVG